MMKQCIEILHAQKRIERIIRNGVGKKIVGPSKLKLWNTCWGQGVCKCPLVITLVHIVLNCFLIFLG